MTSTEIPTTVSIPWTTDIITVATSTDSPDGGSTSIATLRSPTIILVWFSIVGACLVYGLGFIGNILSLIIFCSLDEFRKISTGALFLFTTVSNSFHLWTLIIEFLGVYDIYIFSDVFMQCRFSLFLQNVTRAMSTYLAIGIALDRFVRSEMPVRSRRICTRTNAIKYTLTNLAAFVALWSIFFCPTIVKDAATNKCDYTRSATVYFLLSQVQVPLRMVLVCIVPVVVMSVANLRMLSNMRQSRRRIENRADANTTVSVVGSGSSHTFTGRRMRALDRMLFYMMLANVVTFIVTQIPFHVYTIVRSYYKAFDPFTHLLVRALLLIWSSLYYGIAFYVYCLASPLFRKKFVRAGKKLVSFVRRRPA